MTRLFAAAAVALTLAGLTTGAGAAQAQVAVAAPADTLAAEVAAATEAINPQLIEWRRHLHQHPELGFAEVNTAAYIAERLRGMGLEVRTGIGKTGVVAILRGGLPGDHVVALRSDMDALPVLEATGGSPSPRPTPGPTWARPCPWPTPAATTPTWPCCWAPPRCCRA